jgi:hypothetical protein
MVGLFMSGYFFEILGTFKMFMISSLIALTGGLLLKSSQVAARRLNSN